MCNSNGSPGIVADSGISFSTRCLHLLVKGMLWGGRVMQRREHRTYLPGEKREEVGAESSIFPSSFD